MGNYLIYYNNIMVRAWFALFGHVYNKRNEGKAHQ